MDLSFLKSAIRVADAKPAKAEHPMIVELLKAATAFSNRTDAFAAGKEATCRDMALKLARFGDFASDKQRDFAAKLVLWSQPRADKPAADVLKVPHLFVVLQRHSTFHAGQLKISRRNGDTLCWLTWDATCIGKIDGGVVTLFTSRLRGFPAIEGRTVEACVRGTLQEFDAAPLVTAIKYGKLSGRCCSCGRDLTNPASIGAGIGPVCATKFT